MCTTGRFIRLIVRLAELRLYCYLEGTQRKCADMSGETKH